MIDIVSIDEDIGLFNSSIKKAENVVSVQLGKLTYAPDFGVDLRYFLNPDFQFQNDAFKAYLLQRLTESGVDVSTVIETVNTLYSQYVFNLASTRQDTSLVR